MPEVKARREEELSPPPKISAEQIQQILQEHQKWLNTDGRMGKKAVLIGADLSGAYLYGANLVKADLKQATLSGANLTGANLAEADFSVADLSGAILYQASLVKTQFKGANLQRAALFGANCQEADFEAADLQGANLSTANLPRTHLRDANLRGGSLSEANFDRAQLLRADLREADLQDANLEKALGLVTTQLAATNVSGAKLPESIGQFEGLKQVQELSKGAKHLFISMLLGCVYSWLTLSTTTDVHLLTNSASTPLPIIQVPVPIALFHGVAPVILLSLFVYFHLYLERLWRELANLPAIFPDGKRLDEKAYPWLLNGIIRSHFVLLQKERPPLSRLEVGLAVLLAWWVVPFTTALFWLRSLQRHDWLLTGVQVSMMVAAILYAWWFQQLAKRTLRGQRIESIEFKGNWLQLEPYKQAIRNTWKLAALGIVILILGFVISDGAINGVQHQRMWRIGGYVHERPPVQVKNEGFNIKIWIPRALEFLGCSPFAELTETDVSTKPADWTGSGDSRTMLVKGANLKGRNLTYANASRAFLGRANLMDATLRGAFLVNADLREANLMWANLSWAFLHQANLEGANLAEADLSFSQFDQASLARANLERANLQAASLRNANLSGANLFSANLQGSLLKDANFEGANLKSADLRNSTGLTNEQLRHATADEKTQLPDNLKAVKGTPPAK